MPAVELVEFRCDVCGEIETVCGELAKLKPPRGWAILICFPKEDSCKSVVERLIRERPRYICPIHDISITDDTEKSMVLRDADESEE